MNYLKTIFIMVIAFSTYPIDAGQSALTNSTTDMQLVETATEKTELAGWQEYLDTLQDNWDSTKNIPLQDWTDSAIKKAKEIIEKDKTLRQDIEKSFLDAINKQTTTITPDIIALITQFNEAISEEPIAPETTSPEKEELTKEDLPVNSIETIEQDLLPTEQSEAPEIIDTPIMPETPAILDSSFDMPLESEITEPPKDEKAETLDKWKNFLQNMRSSRNDINVLMDTANDLGQQLKNLYQIDAQKILIPEFKEALLLYSLKNKLPSSQRDYFLSDFAIKLGVYMPTSQAPKNQYQPNSPELGVTTQQEEMAEIRRKLAEQEAIAQQTAAEAERQKEDMKQQAVLKLAAEKGMISEIQRQKFEISRIQAEQKATAELLEQQRDATQQWKSQLLSASAEQKAAAQKGIFSAAKDIVSAGVNKVANWWSGTPETQQPVPKTDEPSPLVHILAAQKDPVIKAEIEKAFTTVQATLFAFKDARYWDQQKSGPTDIWVTIMQNNLATLIKYKILLPNEALAIIVSALDSYPKIDDSTKIRIKNIMRPAFDAQAKKLIMIDQAQRTNRSQQELQQEAAKNRLREEMEKRELIRREQLEKERVEKEKRAASDELKKQIKEFYDFMNTLRLRKIMPADIQTVTNNTIQKSLSILSLMSQLEQPAVVDDFAHNLKSLFITVLLDQNKNYHQNQINITTYQTQFDQAIRIFLDSPKR